MDRIANTTSLISGVVDVYNQKEFQKELTGTLDNLQKRFHSVLSDHANEYKLETSNSVRPVKYFSVVGRIKEKDSFHEKLIRGNLIYTFLKTKSFKSKKEISSKKKKVCDIIKQISDDIIGVKILTELEDDCKKVIQLFRDKHRECFNDRRNIYLSLDDIERQPVRMRNGLEFYKISGVYATSYKFELQIKSKLLSVWGDMDHSMFYKDYSVSPVKENVKQSMINLGGLITQVDKFLLLIREAENSFSKNREVIDFTEKFSNQYSKLFKIKLGFGYRLEDISEFLFFMYQTLPVEKRNIKARIDFSILGIKTTDPLIRSYQKVRDQDFNLQIIELVYFNWFSNNVKDPFRKVKNLNTICKRLIDDYLLFIISHLKQEFVHYSTYLNKNIPGLFIYLKSGSIFYNFDKINSFLSILVEINNYSDIEEGKYDANARDGIQNFILLLFYRQDAEAYLRTSKEAININDLILTLSMIRFPFKDRKDNEMSSLSDANELIQRALFILKKISDEIPN